MNGSIEWHANETAMLVTEPMTYWQRERERERDVMSKHRRCSLRFPEQLNYF